jgi:hypothetical protein
MLEGRQIIQIKGILVSRPCRGYLCYCSSILRLRAALRRFTPGYCSGGAFGAKKVNGIGRGRRRSRAASRLFSLRFTSI